MAALPLPWEAHRAVLPAGARADLDAWLSGARDLASFVPAAWSAAPAVAAFLGGLGWATLEASLRTEFTESAEPIYPPFHTWFRPLQLVASPADVRVILPATDPYPFGAADGLAFSVVPRSFLPDTLRNILWVRNVCVACPSMVSAAPAAAPVPVGTAVAAVPAATGDRGKDSATAREGKEPAGAEETEQGNETSLTSDVVGKLVAGGSLEAWAVQGVLLLNLHATVRARVPKSHRYVGWDGFARAVVTAALDAQPGAVSLFLGGTVRTALEDICTAHESPILATTHPCDLTWEGKPDAPARAFKTALPFVSINELLVLQGLQPIAW